MSDIDSIEMTQDLSECTEDQLRVMKKSWEDECDIYNRRMLKCRSVIIQINNEVRRRQNFSE